jgi:hypothetical protein
LTVGPTANGISIADPNDRGMIAVAGCAPTTPDLVADFLKE